MLGRKYVVGGDVMSTLALLPPAAFEERDYFWKDTTEPTTPIYSRM